MINRTAQNQAHRNDPVWIKTKGKVDGYLSEYTDFDGRAIRKDWRMTGQDWIIFDAAGEVVGRAHSLTYAKFRAAELLG